MLCKQAYTALQDRTIGHQVITLSGAVPAANYLQLPQDKVDSLALTGRFLYLQVLHYTGMFTWHGLLATLATPCTLCQTADGSTHMLCRCF